MIRVEIAAFKKNEKIKTQEILFEDKEIIALQVSNERPEDLEDDVDYVYLLLSDGFFFMLRVGPKTY